VAERRGRSASAAALALALLLAGCVPLGSTPAPSAEPGSGVPADAIPMEVVSITDGDTLRLRTDEPGELVTTTRPIAVRLIGIDTPEVYPELECFGEEAEDELARLAPEGATVWVAPDVDSWDRYDRRLFYLWTEDGLFVNRALVEGGFAEAIRVRPNVAHLEELRAAQAEAEVAGLGMWAACR